MSASGDAQEARPKDFVRRLGYAEVVIGEANIKALLQIKVVQGADSNCADIVGFKPNFKQAASTVVCESKGTDVEHALVQLGYVAAALLETLRDRTQAVRGGPARISIMSPQVGYRRFSGPRLHRRPAQSRKNAASHRRRDER